MANLSAAIGGKKVTPTGHNGISIGSTLGLAQQASKTWTSAYNEAKDAISPGPIYALSTFITICSLHLNDEDQLYAVAKSVALGDYENRKRQTPLATAGITVVMLVL